MAENPLKRLCTLPVKKKAPSQRFEFRRETRAGEDKIVLSSLFKNWIAGEEEKERQMESSFVFALLNHQTFKERDMS